MHAIFNQHLKRNFLHMSILAYLLPAWGLRRRLLTASGIWWFRTMWRKLWIFVKIIGLAPLRTSCRVHVCMFLTVAPCKLVTWRLWMRVKRSRTMSEYAKYLLKEATKLFINWSKFIFAAGLIIRRQVRQLLHVFSSLSYTSVLLSKSHTMD